MSLITEPRRPAATESYKGSKACVQYCQLATPNYNSILVNHRPCNRVLKIPPSNIQNMSSVSHGRCKRGHLEPIRFPRPFHRLGIRISQAALSPRLLLPRTGHPHMGQLARVAVHPLPGHGQALHDCDLACVSRQSLGILEVTFQPDLMPLLFYYYFIYKILNTYDK